MLNKRTVLSLAFIASCLIAAPSAAILFSGAPISGSGGGNLTTATVINPVASSQTNMPYTQGLVFAPNAITSSQHVVATDPDTGLPINCQEDNRFSDLTVIRGESLTCVFPSVTSSQVKSPVYSVAAGAPATGTDITVGEISAWLTLNSYNLTVDFQKVNGVTGTTTADLASALASGNSGWVNATTATVMGKWRGGGGLLTEYIVYAPAKKSGTADAQLRVIFDVGCYKAARTAVNTSTNPILKCFADAIEENAFLQNSTPVNNWYGLCITKASACDIANLANTTPTQTLSGFSIPVTITIGSPCSINGLGKVVSIYAGSPVIFDTTGSLPTGLTAGTTYYGDYWSDHDSWVKASVGAGSYVNCSGTQSGTQTARSVGKSFSITASTALFNINDQGRVISDGTGLAVINKYVDSTHVEVNIVRPFASGSITSGGYTVYGTNHPFAARLHYRTWLGTDSPTVQAGNVYLGNTWNNGAQTGGPGTYLIASKLYNNYSGAASSFTNDLTTINAEGTNPMAYIQCGFENGGTIGDYSCYRETSGDRCEISVVPCWEQMAIIKYDSNAATRIFTNADRFQTFPMFLRDSGTGLVRSFCNAGTVPTCAGSTNFTWDCRWLGTCVGQTAADTSFSPWEQDQMAHDPEGEYTAAILTGDFVYHEAQQFYGYYAWAAPATNATGLSKVVFSDPSSLTGTPTYMQERGVWWDLRTVINTALLTPDVSNPVLGMQKAVTMGLANNEFSDATQGSTVALVNQTGATGSGKYFNTDGPHWSVLNVYANAKFEVGYGAFALGHMNEQGMLNSDGTLLRDWIIKNYAVDQVLSTDVSLPGLAVSQYITLMDPTGVTCPTQINSWADVWRSSANERYTNGLFRTPNATLTLSGTSGTAITATLSGGTYFGAGTSFYKNGWIIIGADGTNGMARITSITSATTAIIDTTSSINILYPDVCTPRTGATFSATTYTTGNYTIPGNAPTDPVGTEWADYLSGHVANFELGVMQADTNLAVDLGYTGAATARSTMFGLTSGAYQVNMPIQWQIAPR